MTATQNGTRSWRFLADLEIEVFGDRVVVLPLRPADYVQAEEGLEAKQLAEGKMLYVPEGAHLKDQPATLGEVVGLGDMYDPGNGMLFPLADKLQLGDHILHSLYVGQKVEVQGALLRSMRFVDVLWRMPRSGGHNSEVVI